MNLYTSSRYLKKNPTYHSEDSLYKYNNFIKILKKNKIPFFKAVGYVLEIQTRVRSNLKIPISRGHLSVNAVRIMIYQSILRNYSSPPLRM